MNRRCASERANGDQCNAPPLRDGDHCFLHSPEHADEVAEARRLGGLRRRREVAVAGAYDLNGLETVSDIRRLFEIAVLDTLAMDSSIPRNRTLAYLAQVALKALETGELEERIEALESAVRSPNDRKPVFEADSDIVSFSSEENIS